MLLVDCDHDFENTLYIRRKSFPNFRKIIDDDDHPRANISLFDVIGQTD